jgi:hypothetical protein
MPVRSAPTTMCERLGFFNAGVLQTSAPMPEVGLCRDFCQA